MRPHSHARPAAAHPGPVRLAALHPSAVGPTGRPTEDPHPAVKLARALPASIEPMFGIDDLAAFLNCSRRLVERMRSAGKVPKPDIKIGKMPQWKPKTICPRLAPPRGNHACGVGPGRTIDDPRGRCQGEQRTEALDS